jgi:glutamate/aspartate transport system substrate-binding protein
VTYANKVLAALLSTFLLAGPALGQKLTGTLKKIKTTGTLVIGYRDSSPPFSFMGPDKRPIGYSIDLCMNVASAIENQLGIQNLKLKWVPVTIEDRIEMVEHGKVDIVCGSTTNTLSREEKVDFSLMTFVDGGSMLTTSGANISSLQDLAGKRIGVVPGSSTEKPLRDLLKKQFVNATIVHVNDHSDGLAALEQGKIDAYATDRGILIGLIVTSDNPKQFILSNFVFSYEPYGFVVRRNDADFRLVVNRALAALYRSGDVLAIYDHWFGRFGKPGPEIRAMYLLNGLPE